MQILNGAALNLQSKTIQHDHVVVTPAVATKWLETQVRNRKEQTSSMLGYRADMLSGRWHFAGDPLRFDRDGHLIDGQNRLAALAAIEVEDFRLPFLVVRGLDPQTQLYMDQGAKRSAGQQLSLHGVPNGSNLASAVRLVQAWDRGTLFSNRWDQRRVITNVEIVEWAQANPEMTRSALNLLTTARKIGMRPSVGLGFPIKLGLGLEQEVIKFYGEMYALTNLPEGSPTLTLAKRIQRTREESERHLTDLDHLGFLILTWNSWTNGTPRMRLTRPKNGWSAENFPVLENIG